MLSYKSSDGQFFFEKSDITVDANHEIWVSRDAIARNLDVKSARYRWINLIPNEYKNKLNCHTVLFNEKAVHMIIGLSRKKDISHKFINWFDDDFIPSVKKSRRKSKKISSENSNPSNQLQLENSPEVEILESNPTNQLRLEENYDSTEKISTEESNRINQLQLENSPEVEILESNPSNQLQLEENYDSTEKNSNPSNQLQLENSINDNCEIISDYENSNSLEISTNKNYPHITQSPKNMFKFGIYDVLAFEYNDLIWIRRSDISRCLDCTNSYYWNRWIHDNERMYCHVDTEVHSRRPSCFICEHGLYRVLLKSNLKKAIPFQDWVFESLLPSVRKSCTVPKIVTENKISISSILETIDTKVRDIITANHLPDFTNPIKCCETILELLKAKTELEEKYNILSQENEKNKSIINNIISYTNSLD